MTLQDRWPIIKPVSTLALALHTSAARPSTPRTYGTLLLRQVKIDMYVVHAYLVARRYWRHEVLMSPCPTGDGRYRFQNNWKEGDRICVPCALVVPNAITLIFLSKDMLFRVSMPGTTDVRYLSQAVPTKQVDLLPPCTSS